MKLVETIQLKKTKELSELCHKCKNLYNLGLYYINMNYDIMEKYLSWYDTKWMLKTKDAYKQLPAQVSQNVLKYLHLMWKSYFQSLKDFKKNPNKYKRIPKSPKYLNKNGEFIACFNHQHIPQKKQLNKDNQKKILYFPKKANLSPIEIVTSIEEMQQVRIVPKGDVYNLEIVYNHVEPSDLNLNENRILSIDIGVNNLACCVNNIGLQPFVIKGKPLKSINQFYNKEIGRKQKIVSKQIVNENKKSFIGNLYTQDGKFTKKFIKFNEKQSYNRLQQTKAMKKLRRVRNNKIKDYMHKASRYIINYCIEHNIGTIIIGKNPLWKQKIKIGKKNTQNFVQIPFNMLIEKIQYKAELSGIEVILTTEEYTSQTCCKCGIVKKSNRKHRGLYVCSKCGIKINADCNGAYNIMKKVISNALNVEEIEGTQLYPLRIDLDTKTRLISIKPSEKVRN